MNTDTKNTFDISGKVALITGGRSGIGKSITLGLIEAGVKVAVIAKSNDCEDLKTEISKISNEKILYISADLKHGNQRKGLIRRVVDHYGSIDILINNAGTQTVSPISKYRISDWRDDLELLLTSVFDLSKQAAQIMAKNGAGKIINIASISSHQGARNICGYVTAKHGLLGLTKCFAIELAPDNIQVNAIAPGQFNAGIFKRAQPDQLQINNITSRIPMHRLGEPDEIIGSIIFLASNAGNYITGTTIPVDGGWLAR